jgi:hypothetical protein
LAERQGLPAACGLFYPEVRVQMTHQDERRWVLVLIQLEQTRIAHQAAA